MADEISLGAAIFVAVKPIIKIYLIIGVGFLLVKANMLTTETSRGISNMVVNALGPSLYFNKVVTNLSGSKIKDIGVFALSAVMVFGTGFALAVVASFVTPVPQKWKFGLLFAGLFSNISDLPIAYVQSMDTGLVFTAAEGDRAVALTCILGSVQQFMLMNLGMFQIVGLDFKEKNADEEKKVESEQTTNTLQLQNDEEEEKEELEDQQIPEGQDHLSELDSVSDIDHVVESDEEAEFGIVPLVTSGSDSEGTNTPVGSPSHDTMKPRTFSASSHELRRRTASTSRSRRFSAASSFARVRSNESGYSTRSLKSRNQNIQTIIEEYSEAERIKTIGTMDLLAKSISVTQEVGLNQNLSDTESISTQSKDTKWSRIVNKYNLGWLEFVMMNMIRLPSLALIAAFVVAMIPWLRALFVSNSIDIPDAPDNLPPLSFIMDFTSYVGNAAVPMGLLLLGGTLARLEVSSIAKGFWKTVLFMVVCRLVIMPILGVLWSNRLYDSHWINDNISRFLLIVSWSVPSATSQVYFTAFYTPLDGPHEQMDCYAIMLLTQYPLLIITLPFVVTYSLKVDLGV